MPNRRSLIPNVFISYRRSDSGRYAAWICDRFKQEFGADHVFHDVTTIEPGAVVIKRIRSALSRTDVALVLVGPQWLSVTDDSGKRRLDDRQDVVRMEVREILRLGLPVIPVLVDRADPPPKRLLPTPLRPLCGVNAFALDDSNPRASDDLIVAVRTAAHQKLRPPILQRSGRVRERASYTPGTFCWADLSTVDQESEMSFYGELFDWDVVRNHASAATFVSMMRLGGRNICSISPASPLQRLARVKAVWNSYISVDSADKTLARAKQLGARVLIPCLDVYRAGRVGAFQDPQGAPIVVWEPNDHIGASLVNVPGALYWNELVSPNVDESVAFYSELFDWTIEPVEDMAMPYMWIKNVAGESNGGIRAAAPHEPPYWLVYFGADDIDAALAKVTHLGGSTKWGPMHTGGAQVAFVHDPQGAPLALCAGTFKD